MVGSPHLHVEQIVRPTLANRETKEWSDLIFLKLDVWSLCLEPAHPRSALPAVYLRSLRSDDADGEANLSLLREAPILKRDLDLLIVC